MRTRLFNPALTLAAIVLCAGMMLAVSAAPRLGLAQDGGREGALAPEARQAVVRGEITGVSARGMTIQSRDREITVDAGSLTRTAAPVDSLPRYFEEGMFVEVEGTLIGRDALAAARITRVSGYEQAAPPVPPYVVNDPGIVDADEFEPLSPPPGREDGSWYD